MCAAIVYAQPMFIPRIYDICPRTPNVYPRAPTVGADLSCPHITEYTLRIVHVHQRLPTYTHCRGRFIVPAYYGIYGVDNRVQPMFYPRTTNMMRGCIYTIRCERAR